MGESSLKTVMIGFGRVAAGLGADAAMAAWFPKASHLQCLQANGRFEIVGVADPSPKAQALAKERLPKAVVGSNAAELASLQPEIVVLAVPPAQRLPALLALPSVRGIMLEKPLGDLAERAPLIAECKRRNIVAQVHYWRRGDPTMRRLAASELSERIGSPQAVFALYGNGLRNNGSHLVNLIAMLLGRITAVRTTTPFTPMRLPLAGDGHAAFVLDLASGSQVSIHAVDFAHYREIALDIWGTQGRLTVGQEGLSIRAYPLAAHRGLDDEREIAGDRPEPLPVTVGEATPSLYDNLADAIEREQPLLSSLAAAEETETILDAVIASAAAGGKRIAVEA